MAEKILNILDSSGKGNLSQETLDTIKELLNSDEITGKEVKEV